jgi:hypothetical protein
MKADRQTKGFGVLRVGWPDPHRQTNAQNRNDDFHFPPAA